MSWGYEDRYVDVGGHRLRYIEAGSGPALIFQAGLGFDASADQFVPAMRLLQDRHRVIGFDRFGWGWSDRPVDGYTFEAWIDSTISFMDVLGIENATLVGHTLGGWISALVAHQHPERVHKLILVNTAGLNPTAPTPPQNYQLPDRDRMRDSLGRTFAGAVEVTDEMVDEEARRIERPGIAEAYTAILRYINDPDVRKEFWLPDHLPDIRTPTLVVWGDDDPIIGKEHGEQAAELLPNGRLALVDNGEHIPLARQPEAFAQLVNDFLG